MASASRHLCRGFRLASRVTPAKRKCFTPLVQTQRYASTGKSKLPDPIIFSDLDDLLSEAGIRRRDFEAVDPSEYMVPEDPLKPSDLPEDERATYEALPAEEQEKQLAVLNHYKALAESDLEDEQQNALGPEEIAAIVRRTEAEVPFKMEIDRATSPRTGAGYWAEDEEDPYGQFADADNDFFETDISSIAENQLQLHREVRQYSRVAAWEMPLLAKHAKPMSAPTHATPLRFRYTTYLGETHPAAKKVVVEFTTTDLAKCVNLTEPQRAKLQKVLGVRYNHITDKAHISCEKFPNAAQNKRYLGDLVSTLIKTSQDASDMFEDIPLDTRHVKPKKKFPFPEKWLMTEARVKELGEARTAKAEQAERVAERSPEEQWAARNKIEEANRSFPAGGRVRVLDQLQQQERERVEEYVPVR